MSEQGLEKGTRHMREKEKIRDDSGKEAKVTLCQKG